MAGISLSVLSILLTHRVKDDDGDLIVSVVCCYLVSDSHKLPFSSTRQYWPLVNYIAKEQKYNI